jgi:hypothetical protein
MNFAPSMDRIALLALPLVAARFQIQTPGQRPATTPPIENPLQARGGQIPIDPHRSWRDLREPGVDRERPRALTFRPLRFWFHVSASQL